jgi:putative tricarboxylic transport membrane protein
VHIKHERDFWSGVMFIIFGALFAIVAQNYDLGTAQRMGPAFFPTILGGLLVVLGIVILLKGFGHSEDDHAVEKFHFGPIAWVLGSVIIFGATLTKLGFVISMAILVVISSMGSHEMKWKEVIALGVGMAILTYLVFILGLKLTIPVWPWFLEN